MKSFVLPMPVRKTNRPEYFYLGKVFLAFFVPFCVVLFIFHFYIYGTKKEFIRHSLQKSERHEVTIFAESLEEHFDWLVSDLNFVAALYRNSQYQKTSSSRSCDDLTADLLAFSRESKIYDQIRFIDNSGVERIRINYNQGQPISVASQRLQDKKDRGYFKQVNKISLGQVYLSSFDLNVEHGEIEQPSKPTLRVAMPVLNAAKKPAGVIMLNYYGSHLLQHIREHQAQGFSADLGNLSLLNGDGYWLFTENREDEWGWMFADKKQLKFSTRYPEEWGNIAVGENGSFITANGLFTYTTVDPGGKQLVRGKGYPWKLVSRLPLNKADSMLGHERSLFIVIGFLLAGLSAALAGGGVYFFNRKRMYEDELRKLASTDSLTGLLNRRAFLERLLYEKSRFDRHGGSLVIVMADVDHFKLVNDQYGHDAGDHVLRRISRIMQTRMRMTDVLCRWGGEEFLLLLAGNEEVNGRCVAEKMRGMVEAEFFTFNGRDIPVTMSFGVAFFTKEMPVEQCIQLADQRLYYSKKNGRNRVTVTDQEEAGATGAE